MKPFWIVIAVALIFGFAASVAFANPDMLPKHPGYPMGKAVSPVTGQPLVNDPGQSNAGGEKALKEAAGFDDARSVQQLTDENNKRILKNEGAGVLPKVQGPQIKIEPPVKEATKVTANPGK
jgi:hypothetical protein